METLATETGHSVTHALGYDGYDYVNDPKGTDAGWQARASWGRDGWDLGDWPYVIVSTKHDTDDRWGVRYYVEGDLTTTWHPTKADMIARVDELAHFHWRDVDYILDALREEGVDHFPVGGEGWPLRLCGPFSWERLEAYTTTTTAT